MDKRNVILITGANSGIGKAAALELAKTGAQVVMVCRHPHRGQAAYEEVRSLSNNNSVFLMLCDLADLEDVRRFAREFRTRFSALSVLINNAGVLSSRRQLTRDGYELHFGVNYLSHFLLTNQLLDLITKARGRIIMVSSVAHKIGKIHFNDINLTRNYWVMKAYAQAKLATILFTYELDRRLAGTGVTINSIHPGVVATNIVVNRESGFGTRVARLMPSLFRTPAQGAEPIVYLAVSPEIQGVSGKYFNCRIPVPSSARSYDRKTAERLWELSEELTGW